MQNQQMEMRLNAPQIPPPAPLVVPVPVPAVDMTEIMTLDHPNGRLWRDWNETGKLAYLLGLREGLNPLMENIPKHEADTYFPPTMTLSQTEAAVDKFFEDSENIRVPIFAAMRIVTMKVNGATQDQIDSEITLNRQISSKK